MSPALPEAQPGYRWELQVPDAGPRKRHPGRWIAGIVVLVVLLAIAAVAGEWLAREVATSTIRNALVAQLGLPRDQEVEVDVPGLMLLQLAKGSLDEVTVSSEDVTVGGVSGDMTVHAAGVPLRDGGSLQSATATIALDETQLRTLLSTVDGLPADSVGLAAPDVTLTYTLQALGIEVPIGAALTPSAADGDLVLTPSTFRIGDAEVSADDLRNRFGALAQTVLGDWTVCVASSLPAAATLEAVDVEGDSLVATFDVDGRIAVDSALREHGTCD